MLHHNVSGSLCFHAGDEGFGFVQEKKNLYIFVDVIDVITWKTNDLCDVIKLF